MENKKIEKNNEKNNEKNKEKNLNKALLVIIICIILLIVLIMAFVTQNDNSNNNLSNDNNTDNENTNDLIENNTKEKGQIYNATSDNEFINYLNKLMFSDYEKYEVSYNQLRFVSSKRDETPGYSFSIYYNDNILKSYELEEDEYLINNGKFYLLDDTTNEKSAFLVVNEIGPVASHSKYLIMVFDVNGNILFSKKVISTEEILVDNNTISYTFETKMQEDSELSIMADNNKDFCEYLNDNYKDDYIVTGSHKYEYINGNIILVGKIENTIKNYKERNNCN